MRFDDTQTALFMRDVSVYPLDREDDREKFVVAAHIAGFLPATRNSRGIHSPATIK